MGGCGLTGIRGHTLQDLLQALKANGEHPDSVSLDEYLSTWFGCLWRLSIIPPAREHGAALVEVKGLLTVAAARPGIKEEFLLKDNEMRLEGFLGYFHTHPGASGVAFSSEDLRSTINSMQIALVQSGDNIFMVVRTANTPKRLAVGELSNADFSHRVRDKVESMPWQEAVLEANRELCHEYGLSFYAGKVEQPLRRLEGGR